VWETIVPETGLDSAPGLVRATTPGAGVLPGVVARSEALLRCADPGHVEAATSVLDHIARASSSNATATRRLVGSSAASS
jgi:hypothetical protein